MKIQKVFISLFLICTLSAVTLWDDNSFFRLQLSPGDIIKVHFQENKVLKFEQKLKSTDNQNLQGKLVIGEAWGFIPDTTIKENDNVASKSEMTVKQEKDLFIPVKIVALTNKNVYFLGKSSTLINGEMMELVLKGQTDINRITSDLSLMSHNIYDLKFEVNNTVEQDDALFDMEDLIFETNYSDIVSNLQVNGNQTNLQMRTNSSSLSLKFKSIQDDRKKEMVLFYLNAMIKNLFY